MHLEPSPNDVGYLRCCGASEAGSPGMGETEAAHGRCYLELRPSRAHSCISAMCSTSSARSCPSESLRPARPSGTRSLRQQARRRGVAPALDRGGFARRGSQRREDQGPRTCAEELPHYSRHVRHRVPFLVGLGRDPGHRRPDRLRPEGLHRVQWRVPGLLRRPVDRGPLGG